MKTEENRSWPMRILFGLIILVAAGAVWLALSVFVYSNRYPAGSSDQYYDNFLSTYTLQRVSTLDEQERQSKPYRVIVTETRTYIREIPDLNPDRLRERVTPHISRSIIRRNYLSSVDREMTIEVVEDE